MKNAAVRGFRVDALGPSGAASARCSCGACGWAGKESDLNPIVGCSLTAGQRCPAGRCPACGGLVDAPGGDAEVKEALELMQRLVEMDEQLRKGRSLGGDDYGETLKSAKRAAKRALAKLAPGPSDGEQVPPPGQVSE